MAITCPKCGRERALPANLAGVEVQCERCGTVFLVPEANAPRGAEPGRRRGTRWPLVACRLLLAGTCLLLLFGFLSVPFALLGLGLVALTLVQLASRGVWGWSVRLLLAAAVAAVLAGLSRAIEGAFLLMGCFLVVASSAFAIHAKTRAALSRVFRLPSRGWVTVATWGAYGLLALVVTVGDMQRKAVEARIARQKAETEQRQREEMAARAAEANAKVAEMLQGARNAIAFRNMPVAMNLLTKASALPDATDKGEAARLLAACEAVMSEESARKDLLAMSDEEFDAFRRDRRLPERIKAPDPALDKVLEDNMAKLADEASRTREQERQKREEEEQRRVAEEDRKARELAERLSDRRRLVERGFSAQDGSHIGLTKAIRAAMKRPKSYEHVKTAYWDDGDSLLVRTTYREAGANGEPVTRWVMAKVDMNGNVLAVVAKGP